MKTGRKTRSISDFKRNTPQLIREMKESGLPLTLTVNGKAELVVQDARAYQKLLELVERLETIEGIRAGLAEMKAGRGRPAREYFDDFAGMRHQFVSTGRLSRL